jgi:hypothetical protein
MQRDATDQQCFSNIWVRPSAHDNSLNLVILDPAATTMEATSNKGTLAVTNVSTALSWPVASASVTFEPAARRTWYTHLLGQTGWAQRDAGPVEEIRPGDVVWFPPGEKHWHGASPSKAMTHIAIQEALDGKVVNWMEKVSDEQYKR